MAKKQKKKLTLDQRKAKTKRQIQYRSEQKQKNSDTYKKIKERNRAHYLSKKDQQQVAKSYELEKKAFKEASDKTARLIYALVQLRIRIEAEPSIVKDKALKRIEIREKRIAHALIIQETRNRTEQMRNQKDQETQTEN